MRNVFGLERSVPSPEQGASSRMRSNLKFFRERFEQRAMASILVTTALVTPERSNAVHLDIIGKERSCVVHTCGNLRGFASRSGAEVEDFFFRLRIKCKY